MNFLTKARQLPRAPAPNHDPAAIKGNISVENKQLAANIFAWHIANYPGSKVFGHSETKGLRLAEVSVRKVGMGAPGELVEEDESVENLKNVLLEGQTICEITVDEGQRSPWFRHQRIEARRELFSHTHAEKNVTKINRRC